MGMLTAALAAAATAAPQWDVVVYGSTPAGCAAAAAAGHLGMKVAVYEPLPMIGGMGSAGFLALHDGGFGAITGLAYNWTLLNGEAYGKPGMAIQQPESFVSNATFYRLLNEAGVTHIKLDCRVSSATTSFDQALGSSKITAMKTVCEDQPVTATVFIDASYDGDLMVAAGDIPYTWGREAISKYNESLAGSRAPSWTGVGGPKDIDALDADGNIIKYVQNVSELVPPGEADDALMAFEHRLCVAGKHNMVPWPKPEGYNADDFAIMQRCVDANYDGVMSGMPPSKFKDGGASGKTKYCKCCGITVCSADQPHLNAGWANATWEQKQKIIADHTYFEMGSYYYLANDPRVPEAVRERFSSYGLCADEFQEFGNIPPQLYVRISNRMVSDYVMTQNNMGNPRNKPDSIAVSDWSLDEHMTGKYAVKQTDGSYKVMLEGNFWPSVPGPVPPAENGGTNWYDFPYKTMVPKRGVGANLLVAVAFSASAVAYSSTRIESFFMAAGSACGVAAKQLVAGSVGTVQDVNVTAVQDVLWNRFNQQIHGPPDGPQPGPPVTVPKSYTVSGAGSTTWNGKYTLSTNYDSHPLYVQSSNSSHKLYYWGGGWRMAIEGQELFYVSSAGGKIPPTTGWTVSDGKAPAPVLTAGTVASPKAILAFNP